MNAAPSLDLALAAPLELAGLDGALVVMVDGEGKRCATFGALAAWLGYSSKRPLLKLARRYSADMAGLVRVSTMETGGRGRPTRVVAELGWYILAQVAQTNRGRALRRLFATWLRDEEPNRRALGTAGEVFAAAQSILRAAHRRVKKLAKTPRPGGALDKDGKPVLLLVGAELQVMREVVDRAAEGGPVIDFAVGGPQRVAMAHRKPLRRDDA